MEWQKLNKESLVHLKANGIIFWCFLNDIPKIVHPLYKVCLITFVEKFANRKNYWFAIYVKDSGRWSECLTDEDMLEFFSHYCIVDQPERLNPGTSDKEDVIV